MRRIDATNGPWPLHDTAASRAAEQAALAGAEPFALMARAGLATARLALALAPHARRVVVHAGPGNNGGDGLVAATHLHRLGKDVRVVLYSDPASLPADAATALQQARDAGVVVDGAAGGSGAAAHRPELAIDALLGIGARRAPDGAIAAAIARMAGDGAPVLAVDLPSGLHPDTGQPLGDACVVATATLSLLTLKPGLFTGHGRDHAGTVWFDDLGTASTATTAGATARLAGAVAPYPRLHAQHKGSFGDVAVVGGAAGMVGAAWLAARAAAAAGAGRVYVSPLDAGADLLDPMRLELMGRRHWWTQPPQTLAGATVVCGCGGGAAVRDALPPLLAHAGRLVLDADALNAIAGDTQLQTALAARGVRCLPTVLTPHPLEAARLLGTTTAAVQNDRVAAAMALSARWQTVVVLKGSGSIVAAPDRLPLINPTGNALLASAGTGDVLAGWIGGSWSTAAGEGGCEAAIRAVWQHGRTADLAAASGQRRPLPAADLIEAMRAA